MIAVRINSWLILSRYYCFKVGHLFDVPFCSEILSLQEIFRVVVYCSIIKVLCCIAASSVSSTIVSLFVPICQDVFFIFFIFFNILFTNTILSCLFASHIQHIRSYLSHKKLSETDCLRQSILTKRRKRDLNPRAGFPTYTLSRGASSAS